MPPHEPMTDNGIHLTDYGYRRAAEMIGMGLRWRHSAWRFGIQTDGTLRPGGYGTRVTEHSKTENSARAVTQNERLDAPPWKPGEQVKALRVPANRIQVLGIKPGNYDFKVDGKLVRVITDQDLAPGWVVNQGPQFDQADLLRQTIVKKNELFFHRWRPQNNTYLFLFRKHEQGQNAKEIPEFDPLGRERGTEDCDPPPAQQTHPRMGLLRQPIARGHEQSITEIKIAWARDHGEPANTVPPSTGAGVSDRSESRNYAVGREPAAGQADPDELRRRRAGCGSPVGGLSADQAGPGGRRQDPRPRRHRRRRQGRQDDRLRRRAAHPHRRRAGRRRGLRRQQHRAAPLQGHRRRRQGRQAARRALAASAPRTRTTSSTRSAGAPTGSSTSTSRSTSTATSRRRTACVRLNGGGIWQFRPRDDGAGRLHARAWSTPGAITSTAAASRSPPTAPAARGSTTCVPGAMYVTYAGARAHPPRPEPRQLPSICGLEIVSGRHLPDDWQGNVITNDFRAQPRRAASSHRRAGLGLRLEASMPRSSRRRNVAFRPIDVKMGPDGAIYIADWYNPIIQHGEVDFRDPRRDHTHGRIWRVTKKRANACNRPGFSKPATPNFSIPCSRQTAMRNTTRAAC